MENQLITLLRIKNPHVGSFVKNKLEQQGFEVFFTNEDLQLGEVYNPSEVLLKVKAGQSEKAIETLLELHKEYDLEEIRDDPNYRESKKILLPLKLSDSCIELCEFAVRLAQKHHAEIKVMHVYPDPTFDEPSKYTASWEKIVKMKLKEAHSLAQKKLVKFSDEIKKRVPSEIRKDVKLHYRIFKGTPENVISAACKRYKPDVMVIGTKMSREEDGEFMGKTLVKVIENAQFPILAVPEGSAFTGKDKLNVLYTTDFYESDNASLNALLNLLEPYDKKINCIHVELENSSKNREKVDELNAMLKKDYADHNIVCVSFQSSSIPDGINNFIRENNIDLVSFARIKHSAFYRLFHQDLVEALVARINVPMLILPTM